MDENELRALFKATNTAEPLCEGRPGLLRFGLAVAAAEREAIVALAAEQGWAMKNEEPFEDAVRDICTMRSNPS